MKVMEWKCSQLLWRVRTKQMGLNYKGDFEKFYKELPDNKDQGSF